MSKGRYSLAVKSLRHLGRILHREPSAEKLLAMFTAYIDESGIHGDAKICVMAAYLAPEKEWERFIPKWQKVLDDNGINVFHANHCNGNKGEFRKYKDKREERNRFVADLLKTIGDRPRIVPLIAGTVIENRPVDYQRMADLMEAPHPYHVGLSSIMLQIGMYLNVISSLPASEKVACVFDRQQEFSGYAVTLFNKIKALPYWKGQERFTSIAFGTMEDDIPLQAADALAYDSYRDMCRRKYHPDSEPRPSFKVLSKGVPGYLLDEAGISDFLKGVDQIGGSS